MPVSLHAADEARQVLPAHHQVAGQIPTLMPRLTSVARQGTQHSPLLRRQPFGLNGAAPGFMQHVAHW